jgi:hypothetical protein
VINDVLACAIANFFRADHENDLNSDKDQTAPTRVSQDTLKVFRLKKFPSVFVAGKSTKPGKELCL